MNHLLNWADPDPNTNGERWLLETLGVEAREIFDVGAHAGEWAAKALDACPLGRVHCVEVTATARKDLRGLVRGEPRIVVAPRGFGASRGSVRIKTYPEAAHLCSQFDFPHPVAYEWRSERVEPADDYIRRLAISRVDLVKLDIEGAEHLVLDGLQESFREQRIRVVQFEYGRVNIITRFLLRDFYHFFEERGFMVGVLERKRVAFRPYALDAETFFRANYVAVHRDEHALVRQLSNAHTSA